MRLVIESLKREHDRANFQSASGELDLYLRRYTMQDQKRRLSRCYALADADTRRVIGFYTLSVTGIRRDLLSALVSPSKLGKYDPLPTFLLGRLAVDQEFSGRGFGTLLLQNAILRAWGNEFSGLGLVVKAKDKAAMNFCLKNGFERLEGLTAFFSFALKQPVFSGMPPDSCKDRHSR